MSRVHVAVVAVARVSASERHRVRARCLTPRAPMRSRRIRSFDPTCFNNTTALLRHSILSTVARAYDGTTSTAIYESAHCLFTPTSSIYSRCHTLGILS
eukprot:m.329760 g.329760  ORF g.329760 m.329760 type:complete len:99 (-) comp20450_c1_seq17:1695-1991(-)